MDSVTFSGILDKLSKSFLRIFKLNGMVILPTFLPDSNLLNNSVSCCLLSTSPITRSLESSIIFIEKLFCSYTKYRKSNISFDEVSYKNTKGVESN